MSLAEKEALAGLTADWQSHHIQGVARAAVEAGLDPNSAFFRAPLVSEVLPNLWVGGCLDGVDLPADFKHVVSLYPWERYNLAEGTTYDEIKMYDSDDTPDQDEVDAAANLVLERWKDGQTLVHCQAGLNRSNLVVARALIKDGYEPQAAIDLLREKRDPLVLCNATFERWLLS